MFSRFTIALASVALIATAAGPVLAAPCKDAKGKFIACPPPPPAKQVCKDARGKFTKCPQKPVRCQDSKGKFAKCGTPGAKPI